MSDDIFQKFHTLPQDIKNVLTSPESLQAQEGLEEKYNLPLAELLMRIMTKDLSVASLPTYFREHEHLEAGKADALLAELKEEILKPAMPYLEGHAATVVKPAAEQTIRPPMPPQPAWNVPQPVPMRPSPQPQTAKPAAAPPPFVPPAASPRQPASSIQPNPTISSTKAPYFIDVHDEEDIAKQRERLDAGAVPGQGINFEQRADAFVKSQQLSFASDVLAKRFRSIVLARFHDVRDKLGTMEMLTKPTKVGGMEFDQATADHLIGLIEEETRSIHTAQNALPRVPQEPAKKPLPQDGMPKPTIVPPFVKAAARSGPPPMPRPKPVAPQPVPAPMPHVPPPPVPATPRPIPVPASFQPERTITPRQVATVTTGKQMMHDIRKPSRPMGIVEELGSMTPEEFRHLGDTLQESANKVVEKIQLLGDESLARRAEGIAAWRKNSINQLYLGLGRESMVSGKTIDEVIQARERAGQPLLAVQEFAIVADINRHVSV